jgi:hypothetical protein
MRASRIESYLGLGVGAVKVVFTLAKFRAITTATATCDSHYCTCLGYLGQRDMDMIISIYVVLPRQNNW